MSSYKTNTSRAAPPLAGRDDEPLLRILIVEASRRGETLTTLAKNLGVSYERLAQWRRGDASIKTAHRPVHERAAEYLGIPVALVLVLAGVVSIKDFIWPGAEPLDVRLQRELEAMSQDPLIAAFVPGSLTVAAPEVKMLVAWLYREVRSVPDMEHRGPQWLTELHRAAVAHGNCSIGIEPSPVAETNGIF